MKSLTSLLISVARSFKDSKKRTQFKRGKRVLLLSVRQYFRRQVAANVAAKKWLRTGDFLWKPLFARQATRFCRRDKPHKLKLVWFCATQFCTRGDFLVRRIAGAPTCCSYLSFDLCRRSGFSSRLVTATCRQCAPTFKRFGLWEYIIQRWEGDFVFGLAFTWS